MAEEHKEVRITLGREALLDDIKNRAFVVFDTAGRLNAHQGHQIADIAEDGNIDITTRFMNLAVKECENFLYKYTHRPVENGFALNDEYGEPGQYDIEMSVPMEFAKVSVELLKNLLHEFIVNYVLLEWMSLMGVGGELAEAYHLKMHQTKDKIQQTKDGTLKGVRRVARPF